MLFGSAMLAAGAILYLLAGMSASTISASTGGPGSAARIALPALASATLPPAPEPLEFKKLTREEAEAFNASIPFSGLANPAARPFDFISSPLDFARSLDCLTAAVYYEAATESDEGQRAVAQVVLNRVRHPAYPNSVCGVVFQGSDRQTGCQFTFTCDGSLARAPQPFLWERARMVAQAALMGSVYSKVGWATHYHTDWVVPYWSASLVKLTKVGAHIFYRWEGNWGRPAAFASQYAGVEPEIPQMAALGGGQALDPLPGAQDPTALAAAGLDANGVPIAQASAAPPAVVYDPGALRRAILRRFKPSKSEDVALLTAAGGAAEPVAEAVAPAAEKAAH